MQNLISIFILISINCYTCFFEFILGNQLGVEGARVLAKCLVNTNCKITSLDLESNNSFFIYKIWFQSNIYVVLSVNAIGVEGANILARGI